MTFLKAHGIRRIVGKQDWPQFVEQEPEVYEKSELDKLFKTCDARERLYYQFFLMNGMREPEVMYAEWRDVNFKEGTVTVRWKPQYEFSPKNHKER